MERGRRTNAGIKIITEKLDGSMAILFRDNGYKIATRGSFNSDQAIWATNYLNNNYNLINLNNNLTLIFEIIYPKNRQISTLVVDYGNREDLVLLAARDRFTGEYLEFYPDLFNLANKYGFSLPKVYNFAGVHSIIDEMHKIDANQEGWVAEFQDGSRWKFKGDRYCELHKLINGISFKNILQHMQGGTIEEVKQSLPDEFIDEVDELVNLISSKYNEINSKINELYKLVPKDGSRKNFAHWCRSKHRKYSGFLFSLLDGKDIENAVYKMIMSDYKLEGGP